MAARAAALIAASLAALGLSAAAAAHGPCSCTFPTVTAPGQPFRTGPAYKVVWNPAPRDFRRQTTPVEMASGYRADAATAVLLLRPRRRPLRHAELRVPRDAPPGLYFVLIFDGGEGGFHTTWDYVQVRGRPRAEPGRVAAVPPTADDDGVAAAAAAGIGVAAVLAGAAGGFLAGRRSHRRPGGAAP